MIDLNERDERQLRRMVERLELFSAEKISLHTLIADVEFLLGALEDVDQVKLRVLQEQWEVLEEVHAVSLANHDGKLDADALSFVRAAAAALRSGVEDLIGTGVDVG